MAVTLSDLVITTDIDGTLLNAPNPIPPRNLEAIERFTQKGGHFAIASGRSIRSTQQYVQILPVNAPCIVFNGGAVYDYSKEKLLYARYLPESSAEYLREIVRAFPEIGATLLDETEIFSLGAPYFTRKYLGVENQPIIEIGFSELSGQFFKSILSMQEEAIPLVEAFVRKQGWKDVSFVRSSPYFLEMLPLGCSKGAGLTHLAEVMGLPMDRMVSIGDYYNDLEMLQVTGFPVTVAGAPDEIKQICRLVTGECDGGALADLIEYLERAYPPA